MHISVKKDDFVAASVAVSRVISSKTGGSSASIRLIAENDTLILTANDLELAISSRIKAEIIVPGSIVVPGRLLGEAARRFPHDDVTLHVMEGRQVLRISSGFSDLELVGMGAAFFPELPDVDGLKVITLPQSQLKSMLRQVSFAMSQDSVRPILTGMLWEYKGNSLRLVAADGTKVASRREEISEQDDTSFSLVMPGRTVNELIRLLSDTDDEVQVAVGKSHCLIQMQETVVVTKLLEGNYINVDQYVPTNFTNVVEIKPKVLLTALDRSSVVAKDALTGIVKLSLDKQMLTIRAHSAELGSHHEEWPVEMTGEPLEIFLNIKVLSDIMRSLDYGDATISFTGQFGPAVCRSRINEKNYWSLVMPVRLS
ncbi:MAG: DNA polymerase III subunit beta [Firmicutes bacterium]|nr:DNA polymerase III subunit beta [Dethiobacter sp.]MBS3888837.1 DNA polymerase III subunit beta [Bacillota bacterium]MBS4054958.1 DNA polymerase III subunit beta [Thermaerobacter sp.]